MPSTGPYNYSGYCDDNYQTGINDIFSYIVDHVGLGYITPELTFGTSEMPFAKYEFYYRLGITTGGDSPVLYPFNQGVTTPHFYKEDGELGFTSGTLHDGNVSSDEYLGLQYNGGKLTVNYALSARSKFGGVSIYHYGGMKETIDVQNFARVAGIVMTLAGVGNAMSPNSSSIWELQPVTGP